MRPDLKKNPDYFVVNANFQYSDDSSHSNEIRFAINQDTTYAEFMTECDKAWQQFRYVFGPQKFDEVTAENKPVEMATEPKGEEDVN